MRLRSFLWIFVATLALIACIAAGAAGWLLFTEAGLHWAFGQTERLRNIELHAEGLRGRLAGPILADQIELAHERIELTAENVHADLKLRNLLWWTVRIDDVRVGEVKARLKPAVRPREEREPGFLPVPWLVIRTGPVDVGRAELQLQNGRRILAEQIHLATRLSRKRFQWRDLRVGEVRLEDSDTAPRLSVEGGGELRAARSPGLLGELRWTLRIEGQPQYAGMTRFDGNLESLEVAVDLRQPLVAQLDGRLTGLTTALSWTARVKSEDFSLEPWSQDSPLERLSLELKGSGDLKRVQVEGRVAGAALPVSPIAVSFAGAFAERKLEAERFQLALTNGARLMAAGTVEFGGGPPALELQGGWTDLALPFGKPVVRSPQGSFVMRGALPYSFAVDGDVRHERIPPLLFNATGALSREQLSVESLYVRSADTPAGVLEASGRLSLREQKSWRVVIEGRGLNPAIGHESFPGSLDFHLSARGEGLDPNVPWSLELNGLGGQLRNQPVTGEVSLRNEPDHLIIETARLQFGSAKVNLTGRFALQEGLALRSFSEAEWELSAADLSHLLPDAEGQVLFSGRLGGAEDAPELTALLQASGLRYRNYRAGTVQAQADLDLTTALTTGLDPEDAGRVQLHLQAEEAGVGKQTMDSIVIDLEGNTADHRLTTAVQTAGRELRLAVQGAYGAEGGRKGDDLPAGAERVIWQGVLQALTLTGPEGDLALLEPTPVFVGATRLQIDPFCLDHKGQQLCGRLRADGEPGMNWKDFALTASLEGHTRELGFVTILVPEIDRMAGELQTAIRLSGTLGAPVLEGSLALHDGEMDLFAVNLLLRQVDMRLDLHGKALQLAGSAQAGEGKLAVDGRMEWREGSPFGNLDLSGENLLVANVPEARIHASPNISVGVDGRNIQVDGAVRVPYARLAPANLTGAMLPSEDETIVGTPPPDPDKSSRITTGIHLILGDDVRIESYGLSGRITGGIAAYSAPDEVSTATGELRIVEGKYSAYGQELEIERGRLIFTGGLIGNPGVDIRATRKFPEVLAGINVRGTLRDPRLSFFSEPPLPQTQIASLIITGRTFDSLQEGGGPGLGREQLLAQGGALLARQLGDQLGIDEVTVESGANQDTSLVLGKYLSPRLYVGYGISLTESINTLKMRYTLGDRWTIKMEAGEHRSADVVYAIER